MLKLIRERYEITQKVGDKSVTIYADVTDNDELTIQNHKQQPQLNFTQSDKDIVKAMALALHEAANIVTERKVKDGIQNERA